MSTIGERARGTSSRIVVLTVAVVLGLLLLVAVARPAQAAFPGKNGKIVFAQTHCRGGCTPPLAAGEIHTVNPDGSGLRRLTHNGRTVYEGEPTWSSDGKRIAFSTRSYSEETEEYEYGIAIMNADGSRVRKVTQFGHSPTWSPDGKKIAFAANNAEGTEVGRVGIHTVNADGTGLKRLTEGETDGEPSWSPDGKRITYDVDLGAEGTEVYVMNSDGSRKKKIVKLYYWGAGGEPDWSPDGKRIAYVGPSPDVPVVEGQPYFYGTEIFSVRPDGTNKKRHTRFNSTDGRGHMQPSWSPDGKWLTFNDYYSGGASGPGLYVVKADGTGQRRIDVSIHASSPDWQPIKKVRNPNPKPSQPGNVAPIIKPVSPKANSKTFDRTPLIKARIRDGSGELGTRNIQLFVDGKRKSFRYVAGSKDLLTTSSRLSLGRHTARIVATDRLGKRAVKSWSFKIVKRR